MTKLPEHVTMGLLDLISRQAMDEDYAETAVRRADDATPPPEKSKRVVWATGAAFLCFAMLVVTALMQRIDTAEENNRSRNDLAAQVQAAKGRLDEDRARIEQLTTDNQQMRDQVLSNDAAAQAVLRKTRRLQAISGFAAVEGPGIKVTIDNASKAKEDSEKVLDSDLQRVVNGLFRAGAESVAINGQRITSLTSIRTAGGAIQVNYRPQKRPYVIRAIGDPRTLAVRFAASAGGQEMLAVKQKYGLRFDTTVADELLLPAVAPPSLRYAAVGGRAQKGRTQ